MEWDEGRRDGWDEGRREGWKERDGMKGGERTASIRVEVTV